MALNPPMYSDALPMAVRGEFFLLSRKGIKFEASVDGFPKLKAKGHLHLTTLRMVFVAKPAIKVGDLNFTGFDIPLKLTSNEKFNQPIFGANNLTIRVDPIRGMGLEGPANLKLAFNEGGVGTFLPLFIRSLREIRQPPVSNAIFQVLGSGGGVDSFAFVDPNDPSILFATQPEIPVAELSSDTGDYPGVPVAKVVPLDGR